MDDDKEESIPEEPDSNKARSVAMLKGRVFMVLGSNDNKRFGVFTLLSKLCTIRAKSEYDCGNGAPNKWVN